MCVCVCVCVCVCECYCDVNLILFSVCVCDEIVNECLHVHSTYAGYAHASMHTDFHTNPRFRHGIIVGQQSEVRPVWKVKLKAYQILLS